jgi:arylsulfatase A-like enzyme
MPKSRPNFLVILFDALRASDFPGGTTPVPDMPVIESIVKSGMRFPRAASVTPWTIPAHASAFTGLYPWEHGSHAKNNLVLSPTIERLPQVLRPLGYRSALLSANTLVCPRFGLVDGFEYAGWGSWLESYLRQIQTSTPPASISAGGVLGETTLDRVRDGPLGRAILQNFEALYRYPFIFDVLDSTHQHLKFPGRARNLSVAPWIEPTLENWLKSVPESDPTLCVLNIVDTHEPYFAGGGDGADGLGRWWAQAKVRQDFVKCIVGSWVPSPTELSVLRQLYRESVHNLEVRVAAIVRAYQNAGRWDDTSVFLTSDHGQAFGEHGELFHLNGVIDPMLRIPLVYRPADGNVASQVGKGWASLIDIAPTILRELDLPDGRYPSAYPLQDLATSDRATPLLAVSDGLVWNHLKRIVPMDRKAEFDRLRVVAYEGDVKVVVDVTRGETQVFDLKSDPGENHDIWEGARDPRVSVAEVAAEVGRKMSAVTPTPLTPEIEERLRSWGYV